MCKKEEEKRRCERNEVNIKCVDDWDTTRDCDCGQGKRKSGKKEEGSMTSDTWMVGNSKKARKEVQ